MRTIRPALPLVLGVAILLRLAVFLVHSKPVTSDEVDYVRLATELARTGHYSIDGHPTAYRPVGYPAFLAAIFALGGTEATVRLIQTALDLFTLVLLYGLLVPRRAAAAAAAAIIWALYTPAMLFANHVLSEALFTFLLVLLAFLLQRRIAERPLGALAAGAILGALPLVRTWAFPLLAFVPWALTRVGYSARAIVTITIVCVGMVTMWIVRNQVVMGAPVLTTSIGPNLLVGSHAGATGGYSRLPSGAAGAPGGASDSAPGGASASGASAGSAEGGAAEVAADRHAGGEAFRAIAANPARFALLAVKKCLFLMTSEAELAVGSFAPTGHPGMVRFRDRYRSVPFHLHLMVSLPFAVTAILGVLALGTRKMNDPLGALFLVLVAALLLSTVAFFGGSRFRFPLMPFLALFSGEAIADWSSRQRALWGRQPLTIALLLALVTTWGLEIEAMLRR